MTRGAVATTPDMDADPAGAGVWGLVRSAQSENPGRIVLLDAEDGVPHADVMEAVRYAVAADEPQLAVREGRVLVPRWVPAGEPVELVPPVGERAWRLGITGAGFRLAYGRRAA